MPPQAPVPPLRLHPDIPLIDAEGIRWRVTEVGAQPTGWLLFTSEHASPRRFSPIPWGWQRLPIHGLRRLLSRAVAAPMTGLPAEGKNSSDSAPLPVAAVEAAFLRERERRLLAEDLLKGARVLIEALRAELDQTRAESQGAMSMARNESGATTPASSGPSAAGARGTAPAPLNEKRAHFALGLAGAGRYRWHFSDSSGAVGHRSDIYTSKAGARSGIEAFRREATDPTALTAPVIETRGSIL